MRKKNVFSIEEVEYALFKMNGKLSVLKKEPHQTATKTDITSNRESISIYPRAILFIDDGKYDEGSLNHYQVNRKEIRQLLNKQNINLVEDVFYAEMQTDGSLYISKLQ